MYQPIPQDHKQIQEAVVVVVPPQSIPQAQPIPMAQPAQAPQTVGLIPYPPTATQLRVLVNTKRVSLHRWQYIRDAWSYSKHNACIMMKITFVVMFLYYIPVWGVSKLLEATDSEAESSFSDFRESSFGDSAESSVTSNMVVANVYDYDDQTSLQDFMTRLIQAVILFPLMVGTYSAVFTSMRTQSYLRVSNIFHVFNWSYYFKVTLLGFIYQLLIATGVAVIFFPLLTFAPLLHVEHPQIGACRSLWFSCKLYTRYCCSMSLFLFQLLCLQFLGMISIVGIFLVGPFTMVATAFCYNHILGVNGLPVFVPANAPCMAPGSTRHPLEFAQ